MYRSFRTPLIPALQGVSRARLYTPPSTQSSPNAEPSGDLATMTDRAIFARGRQMRNDLERMLREINKPRNVEEMKELTSLHEMMEKYRQYRDELSRTRPNKTTEPIDGAATPSHESESITSDAESTDSSLSSASSASSSSSVSSEISFKESPGQQVRVNNPPILNASAAIHAILTTLRQRSRVLRPVISGVRKEILGSQNLILGKYLNEITDDLVNGRSYASRFALAYLITAFGTMENDLQATITWKRLVDNSLHPEAGTLAESLGDPKVVSAALRIADPEIVSIAELEELHSKTVAAHGRHLLTDEALATSYLKFGLFENAVALFTDILDSYDWSNWETSIMRLYNQIITQTTNIEIVRGIFEFGVAPDSQLQLHPSAVSRYIEHLYAETHDPEEVVTVYERAFKKIQGQRMDQFRFKKSDCLNMTSEAIKALVQQHYVLDGATPEARALVERVLKVDQNQRCVSTVMSYTSKSWLGSDYIVELLNRCFKPEKLDFVALRVALNACQSLTSDQVDTARVAQYWDHLVALNQPDRFDWLALARACDDPARVDFFVEKWVEYKPSQNNLNLSVAPVTFDKLASLDLIETPVGTDSSLGSFGPSLVEAELSRQK